MLHELREEGKLAEAELAEEEGEVGFAELRIGCQAVPMLWILNGHRHID